MRLKHSTAGPDHSKVKSTQGKQKTKNIGLFFPTRPFLTPRLVGTRKNFWMKLTPQNLERWGYRAVKISLF